jgi:hypothetical protein
MIRLFGGILLGVGILVAGASGLCSAVFLVSMLGSNSGGMGDLSSMLAMIAVVGGIPFAIGMGLVWAGRHLLRKARAEDE